MYALAYRVFELSGKVVFDATRTVSSEASNYWGWLEAFAVLFTKNETYWVPRHRLEQYGRLLGIAITVRGLVTTRMLRNAAGYTHVKSQVYASLREQFVGNLDALSVLEFFYAAENPYLPEVIETQNFVAVGMNSTGSTTGKYIYTFGQSHCIVALVCVNGKHLLLSHYSRKKMGSLLHDIASFMDRIPDTLRQVDCYIISDHLMEDYTLLLQCIDRYRPQEVRYYGHDKIKELADGHKTYNIKASCVNGLVKVYFTEIEALLHLSRKFSRQYLERGRELVPIHDYKEMSFEKILS